MSEADRMIPYGRQNINQADIEAVIDVLKSDFLTQGPAGPRFERAVADYCGAKHAIAVNSATSALHLACRALDLGPGDLFWTSAITFVASANAALYCGAEVDFIDIDPRTYNMSVKALTQKLEIAKAENRLPKVVMPVHLAGQPCDMKAIHALAQSYGFRIIEDASHAIGGKYDGVAIGKGSHSDITVFSFHPVKIITTGEGGMAMSNDPALARRLRLLSSHGTTREPAEMPQPPDGPWSYQQIMLGLNFRMTDLQAALGFSQMARLDELVTRRHQIAARYDSLLADLPLSLPWQDPDHYSSFHLYIIHLQLDKISCSHRNVFETLRAAGIGVNLHYMPVYLQPYYLDLGFAPGHCPQAENYYAGAISLPLFPGLTKDQQDKVAAALQIALK